MRLEVKNYKNITKLDLSIESEKINYIFDRCEIYTNLFTKSYL